MMDSYSSKHNFECTGISQTDSNNDQNRRMATCFQEKTSA